MTRIMALDLGEKRIGIALSDPSGTIATPHSTLKRTSRKADFAHYQALIAQHEVGRVVVGLPTKLDGQDSQMTRWVRDYAADLVTHIAVPLVLHDETFTSNMADAALRERGFGRKKRQDHIDAVAAAIFLQDYLETHALL